MAENSGTYQAQPISSLMSLPSEFQYVPCNGNKRPIQEDWLNQGIDAEAAIKLFGKTLGDKTVCSLGLLLGDISGGTVGVDVDGASCQGLIGTLDGELPLTVSLTSGKPGRSLHLYRVPQDYWQYCETHKLPTGTPGEQLELRWSGAQSIIFGTHPETDGYRWIEGQSPDLADIAECPVWIIRQLVNFAKGNPSKRNDWGDREWALSYLTAIPPAEDYDHWLKIGMALKSVDDDLLDVWELWSQLADNHRPGECPKKWLSFKGVGVGIATLAMIAQTNGWRGKSPDAHQGGGQTDIDVDALKTELTQRNADFDLRQLFHLTLCTQIESIAQAFNQPAAVVAAPLLAIAGSLLRVGTLVHLSGRTDHTQPPIVWVCLPGDSDGGKSPILKILTKPLQTMQSEAWMVYQQQMENWEYDMAAWEATTKKERGPKPKPPALRRHVFEDFTTESIASSIQAFPERGGLVNADELATVILGFNQYKKTGNDRQKWLSLYDGGAINVSRKTTEPIFIERTNLPVVGGIQPVVLRDVMGKLDHVDGFWPRFFYAPLQNSRMPVIDFSDDADTGIEDTLTAAYQGLYKLPGQVYRLSPGAQQLWREWHEHTEDSRFQHDRPATKTLFRKARARAARIALVVHCLNAAIEGVPPSSVISAETLNGAIEYTRWGLNQILSIYADFGVTDSPEVVRAANFVRHFKEVGWVNARRVCRWWYPKSEITADKARDFMTQIVSSGLAISNGQQGKNFQICIRDGGDNGDKFAEASGDKPLAPKTLGDKFGEVADQPSLLGEICHRVTDVSPSLSPSLTQPESPGVKLSGNLSPLSPPSIQKILNPLEHWPPKKGERVWIINPDRDETSQEGTVIGTERDGNECFAVVEIDGQGRWYAKGELSALEVDR
jgi:hypothetical protein